MGDFAIGQGIEIPLAGLPSRFAAWGVTAITSYSRSSNVATFTNTGPTLSTGQVVNIAGLADSSFNGPFTILANDGDAGQLTVANKGSNVGVAASSGTAILTSAQVMVTPTGILNGSTTYDYKVVLRGYNGELSAASTPGVTHSGAPTLGINTATMALCSRSGGTATCTTSGAHNFQAGATVDVEGSSTRSLSTKV